MVNPSNYVNSEDDERTQSPLPNSQGSETSIVEVNELEPTDDHMVSEDIMANTQAVMDLPAAPTKKSQKSKGKGLGKTSVQKQKKGVQAMSFFLWLKSYWDSDSTVQIMGKFVTAIKEYAMKNQNANLGRLVRPINQIMKSFISCMDKQRRNLKKISWESFELWALDQGLSTMYTNGQVMEWQKDFEDILFQIYGQVYVKWSEEKQAQNQTSDEEEEESSSLRNTMTTSMSSTTAPIQVDPAVVDLCDISPSTLPKKKIVTFSRSNRGQESTKASTSKLKTSLKKSSTVSAKRPRKTSTTDEESEEELVMPTKKTKVVTSDSEEEDSENLNDILDAAVRAQCLLRSTGSICQTMSLKHQDNVITLKSRGERGQKVVKFEIYPYNDCLRKDKQEWWKFAEIRSLFLTYSEDSRVSHLMNQLIKEAFKQIQQTKKVEIKTVAYKRT